MKKIFTIFTFLIFFSVNAAADEDNSYKPVPDISFGINGSYGSFNLYSRRMNLNTKPGIYTGGGISVEKMLYSHFGIGSGVQYRYFNTDFVMEEDSTTRYDATWTFQTINLPFLMILSFRGNSVALNLVGGAVYSHIFYSEMESGSSIPYKQKDNVLRFTRVNQIGLTAGMVFKIKTTQYTDFLFGVMCEGYPTNLLYNVNDSKVYMYNYSLTAGYMFRTNLFSGSGKKD